MTPSPGTICRSAATISSRRARIARSGGGILIGEARLSSALPRLVPRVGLVDDVDAPLPPHDAAALIALLQRLKRIDDLHARIPCTLTRIGTGAFGVKLACVSGDVRRFVSEQ